MIKVNWTWTLLIAGSSIIALLSCHRIEYPGELFLNFISQVFVYGLCLWVIFSILGKIYGAFKQGSVQVPPEQETEDEWQERRKLQQQRIRQSMQAKYDKKTQDYRKRIIEPKEEERKKKQEQELNLIRGHVFKGQGQESGFDEDKPRPTHSENNDSANSDARKKRHLPDHVILHRPRQDAPTPAPTVNKRVIKLPDEPDEADDNVVTMVLHTPLDQKYSRRFLCSCKLQVIFDYMTTLGFSRSNHTLVATFPQQQLADMVDKSLLDLKFGRRTVLHIAEKY